MGDCSRDEQEGEEEMVVVGAGNNDTPTQLLIQLLKVEVQGLRLVNENIHTKKKDIGGSSSLGEVELMGMILPE